MRILTVEETKHGASLCAKSSELESVEAGNIFARLAQLFVLVLTERKALESGRGRVVAWQPFRGGVQ